MPKSYGFAIGNLRARENSLLRQSDLVRLSSSASAGELASALRDSGIADRTSNEPVPKLLAQAETGLWEYLREIAPDWEVFEPFLAENDFHNLKAALKALVRDVPAKDYFIYPAPTDTVLIERAVREKDFSLLPEYMRQPAARAYDALLSGADPRLCDTVIDRACRNYQLSAVKSKKYRCPLGKRLIETSVLLDNIKTALRCAESKMSAAFIGEALADTEYPSAKALKNAALGGTEQLLSFLLGCGGIPAAAAEEYKKSPAALERFADDTLTEAARAAKLITLGSEPVLGYYMARRAELKNLRIIYCGIKTGRSPEQITERLRVLYG